MNNQGDGIFLSPEGFNDTSRYSTPRSSICDGASTDCEADVESNLSANSENLSPCRRRSSHGIYGIASPGKCMLELQNNHQGKRNATNRMPFSWSAMSAVQKSAALSALIVCILLLLGILFLLPTCEKHCSESSKTQNRTSQVRKNWPIEFKKLTIATKMTTSDVTLDGVADIILVLSEQTDKDQLGVETQTGNKSIILAIDGYIGKPLKRVEIEFQPFWIDCNSRARVNSTCFLASSSGTIAKVSVITETIDWSFTPCQHIHSVSIIEGIYENTSEDLILVCSWSSSEDIMISGIVLVSNKNGNVIGSKIRYQLNQQPSSFLMHHIDAKNNTCILFGTRTIKRSTVWAVRLKRLVEIATGTRKKVNLVSENPLLVVKNARTDVEPLHHDISGDGVKEIGFVLQDGLIAFINGATFKLHTTINARPGNIIKISMLPMKNFNRQLIGVFRADGGGCKEATLSIFDFKHSFDPYIMKIPHVPMIIKELDKPAKKLYFMAFGTTPETCRESKVDRKEKHVTSADSNTNRRSFSSEAVQDMLSDGSQEENKTMEDVTNDIDIAAIDKDVLDNLKEYVGIDDKGVTKNHKLFHLVCNYLLLRFLISYGITTDSILRDFWSTRYHLLNLSNRNLGHALTDQLKGLLATDYSHGRDSVMMLDQVDNDIDWLMDANNKEALQRKRRDTESDGMHRFDNDVLQSIEKTMTEKAFPVTPSLMKEKLYNNRMNVKSLLNDRGRIWEPGSRITTAGIENEGSKEVPPSRAKAHTSLPVSLYSTTTTNRWLNKASKIISSIQTQKCNMPESNIKMLEIDKENYEWRNITSEGGTSAEREKMGQSVCQNFNVEVKDIMIYNSRIYYVTLLKPILKGDVITQLRWAKLSV